MEKDYKYLPAIISLSAGLIVSITMLVNKSSSIRALITIFAFLLGFYIVGAIFRAILVKFKTKEEIEENKEPIENIDLGSEEKETIKNEEGKEI